MAEYIETIIFLILLAVTAVSSRRRDNAKRAEFGVEPEPIVLSFKTYGIYIVVALAIAFSTSDRFVIYSMMLFLACFGLIEHLALYFLCTEKVEAEYIGYYSSGGRATIYKLAFEYRYEYDKQRVVPINVPSRHWHEKLYKGEEVILYVMPGHPKICWFDKKFPWLQVAYHAFFVAYVLFRML